MSIGAVCRPGISNSKRNCMKPLHAILLCCFLSLLIIPFSASGQFYIFKEVVVGSYASPGSTPSEGSVPTELDTTTLGGLMEAEVQFRQAGNKLCTEKYQFTWSFTRPIDTMEVGDQIQLSYQAKTLGGNCTSASAKMIGTSARGMSPSFAATGYTDIGGLTHSGGGWIKTDSGFKTTTVKVINASRDYATIRINFESTGPIGSEKLHFEVVYVLERTF